MEILKNSTPRAIKEHTCMWCGGKIKKGEIYESATIKNDDLYIWKNHLKCRDLTDVLEMDFGWDGLDGDNFMSEVYEFLSGKVSDEEFDELSSESAVDKCFELLRGDKQCLKI